MKQFGIFHKPNMAPIGFYCTEEAGMGRMQFLSDSTTFGLFEVEFELIKVLQNEEDHAFHNIGTVCTVNDSLLNIHLTKKTAFQYKNAIDYGTITVCDVKYVTGKEIRRPKKDEDKDEI